MMPGRQSGYKGSDKRLDFITWSVSLTFASFNILQGAKSEDSAASAAQVLTVLPYIHILIEVLEYPFFFLQETRMVHSSPLN